MGSISKPRKCSDYHVAWICSVADVDLLPARLMLDEQHPTPPFDTHFDENTYVCGSINGHLVVIATCPQGENGNINTGRLTSSLFKTFSNIRMAVLVGVGSGIPGSIVHDDPLENIHLGDVVVGWPGEGPACVYYEQDRSKADGRFEVITALQNPDWRLTNALGILVSDLEMGTATFEGQLARLCGNRKFSHPGSQHDVLFRATYRHLEGSDCTACDRIEVVHRPNRIENDKQKLIFHRGRIATGNAVIRDAVRRNQIGTACHGALCVETEGAGISVNRRFLVFAAGNAAAFTRGLLCRIQPDLTISQNPIPEGPWVVPFVRSQSFVGREEPLVHLKAQVLSDGYQRHAICGLGGSGKTSLALELAYQVRVQQPLRAIFWVPAFSQESFEQAYREIGEALKLPGMTDENTDIKRLVKTTLSEEIFGSWLLILDNADDLDVLTKRPGDSPIPLIDYIPRSDKGSILITTRTRAAAVKLAGVNVLPLGKLDPKEALQVLETHLLSEHRYQLADESLVSEFLAMLSFLALAIVQAAAFTNVNAITLSEYIEMYQNSENDALELLSEEIEDQGRFRDPGNSGAAATTWFISFENIKNQNQLAADYMCFMACIASNDIPASILPEHSSLVQRTRAIGALKAYSFITERHQESADIRSFDAHPLVHMAIRNWLKQRDEWNIWVETAMARLNIILADIENFPIHTWVAYLPHVMSLLQITEDWHTDIKFKLLEQTGYCEYLLGNYRVSERFFRQVVEWNQQVLGREDPATLNSMRMVGRLLSTQDEFEKAYNTLQEIVEIEERTLGGEHEYTLTSMKAIGEVLFRLERYEEAEKIQRRVSSSMERCFGKDYPDLQVNRANLARTLHRLGNYSEAENVGKDVVDFFKRKKGMENRETVLSMLYLASSHSEQRKYKEAEELLDETRKLSTTVFGEEHPVTLQGINMLVFVKRRQKRHVESEELVRRLLPVQQKILGKHHPDTLTSMANLARALYGQENYLEAEDMYRKTLVLQKSQLGKEHPDTLDSMKNLGAVLYNQDRYAEALELLQEAYSLNVRIRGETNSQTINSLQWLTATQGRIAEQDSFRAQEQVQNM